MIIIRGVDGSLRSPDGDYVLRTHSETQECREFNCVVHNPSEHHMSDWTMFWREDRKLMERLCPCHGQGHPDPDQISYWKRHLPAPTAYAEAIHGCFGCCQ